MVYVENMEIDNIENGYSIIINDENENESFCSFSCINKNRLTLDIIFFTLCIIMTFVCLILFFIFYYI